MDVTLNIAGVINFIVNKIIWVFNSLQQIKFLGTNMLAFSLTILILGTILPLLFTIQKNTTDIVGENSKGRSKGDWTYNRWKEGGFK